MMLTIERIKNKAEAYYYEWLKDIADHDAPYAPLVLTRIADDGSLQEDRLALMRELVDGSKRLPLKHPKIYCSFGRKKRHLKRLIQH
jgi:hypothetical protein